VENARGIVRSFLKKRGVGLEQFRKPRKGHCDKVLLARKLMRSATMTMAWIARELNEGVQRTALEVFVGEGGNMRQYEGLTPFFGH
jgi:hypothetical protein